MVYYYNCPILLLVIVVNPLLCLIYKVNFIISMHVEEKHCIDRDWSYSRFQVSTGGS
jgi:steroid 5-alpha reductase family enzyme